MKIANSDDTIRGEGPVPEGGAEFLPNVVKKLRRRWQAKIQKDKIDFELKLYIPSMFGVAEHVVPGERVGGVDLIRDFLQGDARLMLLLGDSGSGKTMFGQWLANDMWEKGAPRIPLFIHLPQLKIKNRLNCQKLHKYPFLEKHLEKYLYPNEIAILKKHAQLLLILDSYDEMSAKRREYNLYEIGDLHLWNVKVLISCRSEALVKYKPSQLMTIFGARIPVNNPLSFSGRQWETNEAIDCRQVIDTAVSFGERLNLSGLNVSAVDSLAKAHSGIFATSHSVDLPSVRQNFPDIEMSKNSNNKSGSALNFGGSLTQSEIALKKVYIQFFDLKTQVPPYIDLWKKINSEDVDPQLDYLKMFYMLPGLSGMITNPFILWAAMFALKDILASHQALSDLERNHLTRLELFDHFATAWFNRQASKLIDNDEINPTWGSTIAEDFRCYCEQLANCLWQNNLNSVSYDADDQERWGRFFSEHGFFNGDRSKDLSIVRQGALLKITDGNQYSFLHLSLLEYFASKQLFRNVANKVSIALGLEINKELLTANPAMIRLGVDNVAKDLNFEKSLRSIIEDSKHEPRIAIAAANAITILVAANKSFVAEKFGRIRIPYANVSGANFDETDMRDADLRGVNFSRTWLTRANLSGSCVDQIQTGDLPWDEFTSEIVNCFYLTPESERYIVVTKLGWDIYATNTHQPISGHRANLGPNDEITAAAISINAGMIILGTYQGRILLHNFSDANLLFIAQANQSSSPVLSLALNADATLALSSSYETDICVWAINDSSFPSQRFWNGHRLGVNALAISQHSLWAISGSDDKSIKRWSIPANSVQCTWHGHIGAIDVLILSPDERYAFSGSKDRSIKQWDISVQWDELQQRFIATNPVCVQTFVGHTGELRALACSHDGKWLFSGSKDNTVRRWDLSTGACISIWSEHADVVTSIALSPDDTLILSGSYDKKLKRWETLAGQCWLVGQGHAASINHLVLSHDGTFLLSAAKDNSIKRWAINNGQCTRSWQLDGLITKLIVNAEATWALGATVNGEIIRYDLATGAVLNNYLGHTGAITALAICKDNISFFSGSDDKTIKFWLIGGGCLETWRGHSDALTSLISGLRNPLLYSGSRDATIRCWGNLPDSGATVWHGHTAPITTMAISQNQDWLLSGAENGEIIHWILPNGVNKRHWLGHMAPINALAISPNNQWAMSSDDNNKIVLWEVLKGLARAECSLPCPVTVLKWSAVDVSVIIIAMADGSISVWSLQQKSVSLHLTWRSDPWGLIAKNAQMLGVYGLDRFQENILLQRGMKVQVSAKSSTEVIMRREERIPYNRNNPRRSLFDSTRLLLEDGWVLSIARNKEGKDLHHAFMILESVEEGYYRIRRIDFVLELRQRMVPDHAGKPKKSDNFGQGLIEIADKPLFEMEELVGQCSARRTLISPAKAKLLLENIRRDQRERLAYSLLGSGAIYTLFRMKEARQHHNCLSWCEEHLDRINLKLVDSKWYDGIANNPKIKINDGDEPSSGEKCGLM
jgi:WD40 repeat protein